MSFMHVFGLMAAQIPRRLLQRLDWNADHVELTSTTSPPVVPRPVNEGEGDVVSHPGQRRAVYSTLYTNGRRTCVEQEGWFGFRRHWTRCTGWRSHPNLQICHGVPKNWNIQVLYATHNTNNTLQSTCGFGVLIQYRLWQFGLSSCTRKRLERQESGFYNNMVVVEGFWRNTPQERLSFKSKFRANVIRE
ncbi:hypothetical protein B0H12DRAFT_1077001 [Mycena haematopus]|nr:hypothetical protein B0H12DRAFT_1077001 [Mycena haematopus]